MDRWNDSNDTKLAQLWLTGKLDPKKLDNKSIHKALDLFGGTEERSYNSFAALYKRKANKWTLEGELSGARCRGKCGKLLSITETMVFC